MLDLKNLDIKAKADKGARLYFMHPVNTGEQLDIFMDVLGRDSSIYKNLQKEKQLKIMNNKIANKKELTMEDLDSAEEDDIEMLASIVLGLGDKDDGKEVDFILVDEKKLKFSKKNVVKILTQFPFIKEQLQKFVWDRANFL